MKRVILILIIVIGVVAAVFVFKKEPAIAPGPTESPAVSENVPILSPTVSEQQNRGSSTSQPNSTNLGEVGTTPLGQTATITFINGTATPSIVTIKTGDTVKFINNDSVPHWPASGVHPTHQICPGFDALRGLATGESYSFQFNEAKTCPWHDHLQPSIKGQILVNP